MNPTIFITTPCLNAEATIDKTIQSVVSQAGKFSIRYHVQDGGSQDRTLDKLQYWQTTISSKAFKSNCDSVLFSYSAAPDAGMYDALFNAMEELCAPDHGFLTWINADDLLMPGALSLAVAVEEQFMPDQLSWFGGAVCVVSNDLITACFDRPIPRQALRMGICDGTHWDFLQQEGTFFRKWLWDKAARNIREMKLAGDWELWRQMAHHADFFQTKSPLGAFCTSDQQASFLQKSSYLAEIDAVLTPAQRTRHLEMLCQEDDVTRKLLIVKDFRGSELSIREESVSEKLRDRRSKIRALENSKPSARSVGAGEASPQSHACSRSDAATRMVSFASKRSNTRISTSRIVSFDRDWQYPAITEQHAFEMMKRHSSIIPDRAVYVAFPWATLIDKVNTRAGDAALYLNRLDEFCRSIPKKAVKVTVCQHIYAKKYARFFEQAGITHLFWSHATSDDVLENEQASCSMRILPFPLYPVQVPELQKGADLEEDSDQRKHLFSFVGARANRFYLSKVRDWILDYLEDDPRGLIVGRNSWHYEKLVYECQVQGAVEEGGATALVNEVASNQFCKVLGNSTFSLCPSGTGPNSIRLWESIAAGAIPVILADTWAPPGQLRLWEQAAVFCRESPDEIRALPDQLERIAADPERLSQMRQAMRQIWLMYGPQSFVTDIQKLMLTVTSPVCPGSVGETRRRLMDRACRTLLNNNGSSLLRQCSTALLLDPVGAISQLESNSSLSLAVARAQRDPSVDSGLVQHYRTLVSRARKRAFGGRSGYPAVLRKSPPKICLFGRHSNRTPLSYEPIRRHLGGRLKFVDSPEAADLIVSGFRIDFRDGIDSLLPVLDRSKPPKLAVISEEPLWDITWSGPFTGRNASLTIGGTEIKYTFLGHETSDIFKFDRIPYFLLTSDDFPVRYANLMARFKSMTADELMSMWKAAPIAAAFFHEKRNGEGYSNSFPERDVHALSAYRTEVAEYASGEAVLRVGKGWHGEKRRQDLPDWHLDKLAQLDGRTRVLSAFENVHQSQYVTEKVFDAFAVGAIPAYWAGPGHRIFELVPRDILINTYSQSVAQAVKRISGIRPNAQLAWHWRDTARRLVAIFSEHEKITLERKRIMDAVIREILSLV
ncbi:exostosin family protein [Wenzhouxiangella sp. AB-CW3]|uniref:exostosin domain-containing protein n=1 Tax=Wenzhouxiangella sp. AB-CW3 TaxID=2771012 RepID=UPI00168B8438|nr:exostosin family protein [Wenzhouxiangella sp. AB-CW3]QOC23778.1 exostosin family protein [Wenzhouxiangella sp. AB-CW3]